MKPRLRGVFHEIAFFLAVGLGIPLVLTAHPGKARIAATVFALCVAGCFGASALYHRPTWRPGVRADGFARLPITAGVYLLIAGTYTPFGLLVLSHNWAVPVLTIVWTGAVAAILLKLFWLGTPKWLSAAIAISHNWVCLVAIKQLLKVDTPGVVLIFVGGALYHDGGTRVCISAARSKACRVRLPRACSTC